jgi:hypothetical protein
MVVDALVRPMRIEAAFDDPVAVRTLVEQNGPYRSIASYLPASATRQASVDREDATAPWFRANWAISGVATFAGAEPILHHSLFAETASKVFGAQVRPTTVVVNVNAPMAPGAVHVDIPSFRGANRDRYQLRLLQAMGTSGLFEEWRIVEAGAVWWSYEGEGGAYDYWPDGLAGAMCSERSPFDNVALVADNDRMYHRIGWIGDRDASTMFPASAEIDHTRGNGWVVTDAGRQLAAYRSTQIRISVLWKGQVQDRPDQHADSLTDDRIIERFSEDLGRRGIDFPPTPNPLSDDAWITQVHSIYYPLTTVES